MDEISDEIFSVNSNAGRSIRLAVCDDETTSIEKLKTVLNDYEKRLCIPLLIKSFVDPSSLIKQLKKDKYLFEIVFLDIQIENKNGIDIAKQIHDINDEILIIFISNYDAYMQAGYEVKAFRYILKEQIDTYLDKNITAAIHEIIKRENQVFMFKYKGEVKIAKFSDIIFFESSQRLVRIVTSNGENLFYGKLDEIEKQLNDLRFIRCHKSYLINAEFIESNLINTVKLKGAHNVPISRSKVETIRKAQVWAMRQ
jgi:DNA-binding LytR/AlgR family response regulator